jgi:hypothetical protein
MNYRELRTALKDLKKQGYPVPNLSSTKSILETAYNEIIKAQENTTALIEEEFEVVTVAIPKELDFTPADSIWHLVNIRFDLAIAVDALLYAIAAVKFLVLRSAPHVKKFLESAFIVTVVGTVIFKVYLLPKLTLASYTVGIWGVAIALRVIHGKAGAIA